MSSDVPDIDPPSKIQHPTRTFGAQPPAAEKPIAMEPDPVQMAEADGPVAATKKITAFGKEEKHEERWNRSPNINGTGAIHVKTFHSKLTDDALRYLDQTINEWLDAHPEYEVKFVHSTVGVLTSKMKEPNLICQVWV